jgi:hypothetical protein
MEIGEQRPIKKVAKGSGILKYKFFGKKLVKSEREIASPR